MLYRVLVVDDSTFYRKRLTSFLEKDPSIQVVGHAINGLEAIQKAVELKPDLITMDVEMPVMDGLSAVTKIMQKAPTAILMVSSLTKAGARVTLDALNAGAVDYIPKNFDDISSQNADAILFIQRRVKVLARNWQVNLRLKSGAYTEAHKRSNISSPGSSPQGLEQNTRRLSPTKPAVVEGRFSSATKHPSGKRYQLLFIGASTGGPVALQKVISELPSNFPCPVILVQHMPGTFTAAFAERLDKSAQLNVKLAQDGDRIQKGTVYLAEGGKQLQVTGKGTFAKIRILSAPPDLGIVYHPSIDFTMESLVTAYSGDILSVILTGMGSDGAKGGKLLKDKGATIWAQDEPSCVVYGMPKAVAESGTCDKVLALDDIAKNIIHEMQI